MTENNGSPRATAFETDQNKYAGLTAEGAQRAREVDRIRAVDDDPHTVAARRASELRKMPFEQYSRTTPEWRSQRHRVLLRACNR
jgi:hypothetical protein